MTVCLPFSKIRFLTVNPRTGYILLGFIMFIIIYCYQEFYYLNDIGTVPLSYFFNQLLSLFITIGQIHITNAIIMKRAMKCPQ